MNSLLFDSLSAASADMLAGMPSDTLFQLKNAAADLLSVAQTLVEHLDHALEIKYAERVHALRTAAGKPAGVIHFDDGQVRVTADLPHEVAWDQQRLAELARRLAAHGGDPTDYLEVRYRVSESQFAAWPDLLKRAFVPARTLKTGKPSFRLALCAKGEAL